MIVGIGVDVVTIEKVSSLWRSHRSRVMEVVFTPEELQGITGKLKNRTSSRDDLTPSQERYLATRVAAKEATIKALGVAQQERYELSNIEVIGDGKIMIRLAGNLRRYARQKGIEYLTGSLGSTRELAFAMVIGGREDE